MKKRKNLYHKIYDINNINKIYNIIRSSMNNKSEVSRFELSKNSNLLDLSKCLYNSNYKFSNYRMFFVKEPKYRLVMSQCIKDKIINHLVSYYILGSLESRLIDQNIATRKDKGGAYGFNLVLKYINKLQLMKKDIYVLKIDIKKYFYNINHDILKNKLCNVIKDDNALKIVFDIIDSTNLEYINKSILEIKINEKKRVYKYKISNAEKNRLLKQIDNIPLYEYGRGLPIGNMTSQFMAIFYLNDLDHYIKEVLGHKYYIRYMDDLVILDNDKVKLLSTFNEIEKFLFKEDLEINKKSKLYSLKHGFCFLGYKFIFKNGKLLIRYNNSTIRRIDNNLKLKKINDYPLYYKSIRSYKGYFLKSNSNLKNKFLIVESSMYDKYFNLKKDNKLCLIFIKSGIFCYTFDEDALIMNYLFGYKIISSRVGFPAANMELKVLKKLSSLGISYVVLDGNDVNINKFDNNIYVECLSNAYDNYEDNLSLDSVCECVREVISKDKRNYDKITQFLNNL